MKLKIIHVEWNEIQACVVDTKILVKPFRQDS